MAFNLGVPAHPLFSPRGQEWGDLSWYGSPVPQVYSNLSLFIFKTSGFQKTTSKNGSLNYLRKISLEISVRC